MSALQWCWIGVTITTVIFLLVAVVSAMPKMKTLYTAGFAAVFLAASGITAFGSIAPLLPSAVAALVPPAHAAVTPYKLPSAPVPGAPLANDASAGKVVFTFDDGPDTHTGQTIAELNALNLHGVFFVIGDKAAERPEIIRALVANGEVVGNHTWDHRSLTGKSTGTRPLTQAQVATELARTQSAVVAAGAPLPTLWRPPYGGVNAAGNATARSLGLRVVLDSGDNITDSNDWDGLTARQVAARVNPQLRDGTIIAFHDGLRTAKPATIEALPLIVAYMNAHHLGATTSVRPDATGGVVPYIPGTPVPIRVRPGTQPGMLPGLLPGIMSGGLPGIVVGGLPVPVLTGPPTGNPGTGGGSGQHPRPKPSPTTPAPDPTTPAPVPTTPAPTPSDTTPAPTPSDTTPAPTPSDTTSAPTPSDTTASAGSGTVADPGTPTPTPSVSDTTAPSPGALP
jgi:peptidoglycan/xylan/chitin deacetylase (PgdA/CDA1 family)